MSVMKKLYERAKAKRIDNAIYPLPDNEVCAFDVKLMDGLALHITKDYSNDNRFKLGLRIENAHVHDIRVTISGGHARGDVMFLLDIIEAMKSAQEQS